MPDEKNQQHSHPVLRRDQEPPPKYIPREIVQVEESKPVQQSAPTPSRRRGGCCGGG